MLPWQRPSLQKQRAAFRPLSRPSAETRPSRRWAPEGVMGTRVECSCAGQLASMVTGSHAHPAARLEASERRPKLGGMCNLYSLTKGQRAIRELAWAMSYDACHHHGLRNSWHPGNMSRQCLTRSDFIARLAGIARIKCGMTFIGGVSKACLSCRDGAQLSAHIVRRYPYGALTR